MAMPHASNPVSQDTLITIKISVNEQLKKLKLPLRDLGASVLPDKLRHVLDIKPEQHVVFERFSDSAGGYIVLEGSNPQVFKTLIRAAKAKGKLRLKATVTPLASAQDKEAPVEDTKAAPAPKMLDPIIAPSREPVLQDQRNIGSGIFQFREALASQQTLVNTNEAPIPRQFTTDSIAHFHDLAPAAAHPTLVFRPRETVEATSAQGGAWSVFCNECDKPMNNTHYHCSICDDGDYDLCEECVSKGNLCPGEGHWLIKRFITGGKFINSTTERISPRKAKPVTAFIKSEAVDEKQMPGTFTDESKTVNLESRTPTRTCNSCVIVLPEREFVTCEMCDDYDLCIKCHIADKHGHHPAHGFKPATEETALPLAAESKLAPGRNVRHNAICDGCDKKIYGVRHKCLNCPDFDLCNDCIKDARHSHPRHRFAALYTPIADQGPSMVRHFGIYCDGPLCGNKTEQSYIQGVRYKCTICHDTDFCASCEALPGTFHNRTHPLIKLKTPVRHVNVSTENEDQRGQVRIMGDRQAHAAVPETTPVNAATPVQTVAEIKPTEVKKAVSSGPLPIPVQGPASKQPTLPAEVPMALLNAHFVRDSIPDGMAVEPETRFTQVWTLKNPGPYVWPSGCSVRYVGGDNMLNVDNSHPASVAAINDATESNVVGREVAVGEEVAFKVIMKAPPREGKSISYWRLKAADGTPFGHRLWCDVEVKNAEQQTVVPIVTNAMPQPPVSQLPFRPVQTRQSMPSMPFMPVRTMQPPAIPSEAPPAYDNLNNSARFGSLAALREHTLSRASAQLDRLQVQQNKRDDLPSWAQLVTPTMGNKNFENMSDKERREVLRQRISHVKANILRTREERKKLAEESVKHQATAAAEKKAGEESAKVKKIVEAVAQQEEQKKEAGAEETLEGSQMVFPKLEKESPTSSTYESATSSSSKGKGRAAYVENEDGEVERSATPAPAAAPLTVESPNRDGDDFEDLDDDLEILSADGDESEDDGFITDEEYDILDASDQETEVS